MPQNSTSYPQSAKRSPFAFLLAALFFCLIFGAGCDQKPNNNASPVGFTTLLDSAKKVLNTKGNVAAIHILDQATAKYKNISVADRFDVYNIKCGYYDHVAINYDKAQLYADSMLMVLDKSGQADKYSLQYGIAYFSLGDIAFQKQKYVESYQYYYKGKVIGRNSLNNCTLADYSYRLGMVMYKQEHYIIAADHFKQSFIESRNCDNNFIAFYRQQELLDNAALSFYKAGIKDSARIYYDKALDYINTVGPRYPDRSASVDVARAVVYGNQAQLYMEKKDYGIAKNLLIKSFTINLKKGNDNADAELSELKLAHIYVDENDATQLNSLLQNIRHQLNTVKNTDAEVDWNHLMANYYQSKNDVKTALRYFNKYAVLKDSSDVAKHKLLEIDAAQQLNDMESQATISELKTDNGLQHIYLLVAITFVVMALVIVSLIYWNWKKSKKNVTALSDLNRKIHDQNDSLQRAFFNLELNDKEKDRILRAVAHDLRNPIAGIASLTALMLMEAELLPDQKELLELIQVTTNNSLELIREILEATGSVGAKVIKKDMVGISNLVSNSIELLRFKAAEKGQKIVFEPLDNEEELYISREKMWRVVSNLISNAIKFSPQGETITVKVTGQGADILISVKDNGIGIPPEMKKTVFNMFTEAKRPGTIGEPSFGLGLSISKQIVESHEGQIWFESAVGQGTTFNVLLKKPATKEAGQEMLHQ